MSTDENALCNCSTTCCGDIKKIIKFEFDLIDVKVSECNFDLNINNHNWLTLTSYNTFRVSSGFCLS